LLPGVLVPVADLVLETAEAVGRWENLAAQSRRSRRQCQTAAATHPNKTTRTSTRPQWEVPTLSSNR
jgi:hypothetical protein